MYLIITISSSSIYVFSDPGDRCLEGSAASSASHLADSQYNLDNIWRLLLSARPSRNSRALRSFVLSSALLQHGYVLLRSWQVNI